MWDRTRKCLAISSPRPNTPKVTTIITTTTLGSYHPFGERVVCVTSSCQSHHFNPKAGEEPLGLWRHTRCSWAKKKRGATNMVLFDTPHPLGIHIESEDQKKCTNKISKAKIMAGTRKHAKFVSSIPSQYLVFRVFSAFSWLFELIFLHTSYSDMVKLKT